MLGLIEATLFPREPVTWMRGKRVKDYIVNSLLLIDFFLPSKVQLITIYSNVVWRNAKILDGIAYWINTSKLLRNLWKISVLLLHFEPAKIITFVMIIYELVDFLLLFNALNTTEALFESLISSEIDMIPDVV